MLRVPYGVSMGLYWGSVGLYGVLWDRKGSLWGLWGSMGEESVQKKALPPTELGWRRAARAARMCIHGTLPAGIAGGCGVHIRALGGGRGGL